jgi:hypothetical protein
LIIIRASSSIPADLYQYDFGVQLDYSNTRGHRYFLLINLSYDIPVQHIHVKNGTLIMEIYKPGHLMA